MARESDWRPLQFLRQEDGTVGTSVAAEERERGMWDTFGGKGLTDVLGRVTVEEKWKRRDSGREDSRTTSGDHRKWAKGVLSAETGKPG